MTHVVVTGAGQGLGRAIALDFARGGARVVLVARTRRKLDAVAAEVRDAGGEALPIAADISVPAAMQQVAETAIAWDAGAAGVRVNLVSPGPVDGERLESVLRAQGRARASGSSPPRRCGASRRRTTSSAPCASCARTPPRPSRARTSTCREGRSCMAEGRRRGILRAHHREESGRHALRRHHPVDQARQFR